MLLTEMEFKLTGDKKEIYDLAGSKSYLVAKNDGDGGKYDMIHTENLFKR